MIHRKQSLRCAPEQVRPSTSEEKRLSMTPQAELLGTKMLVEQGNLQSRNYVDMVPGAYPLMQPDSNLDDVEMGLQMQNPTTAPDQFSSIAPPVSETPPLNPPSENAQPPELTHELQPAPSVPGQETIHVPEVPLNEVQLRLASQKLVMVP